MQTSLSQVSLVRTEKAFAELRPGVRTLGQRERSILLLVDGRKTMEEFSRLYDGDGKDIAYELVRSGYLAANPNVLRSVGGPVRAGPQGSVTATGAAPQAADHSAEIAGSSAPPARDSFVGKRSLATTRMFLFDLCERMFARRDPVLAEQFRNALREAKDRDSMLAAGREMIAEIERIAGHERADAISERIAMILPEN